MPAVQRGCGDLAPPPECDPFDRRLDDGSRRSSPIANLAPRRAAPYYAAVRPTPRNPEPSSRSLVDEGLRYEKGGSLARAAQRYEAALERCEDPALRAEALVRLSSVHRARCAWEQAIDAARRSAVAASAAGLGPAYAEALNAEAVVFQQRGDFDSAIPLLERVRSVTTDERLQGLASQNLGAIAARRGDFDEAERRFLDSVAHFRKAEYDWGEAVALVNASAVALDQEKWLAARDTARAAQAAALRVGDQELLGVATLNVAEATAKLGDLATAEAQASEALGLFSIAENPLRKAECLRLLGDVAMARGMYEVARRCWERGLEMAEGAGAAPETAQLRERLDRDPMAV